MNQVSKKSAQVQDGEKSLKLSETHITAYPDPNTLAEYDKVKDGFADRLISMAEKEQDARIKREILKIQIAAKRENTTRWGLITGLLAVLPMYGISFYAFSLGNAVEGASILVGSAIVNLAGVFVARKTGLFDDKKEDN
jgi:uncharacterized membrane protein